jgi:hypothetical protein
MWPGQQGSFVPDSWYTTPQKRASSAILLNMHECPPKSSTKKGLELQAGEAEQMVVEEGEEEDEYNERAEAEAVEIERRRNVGEEY